jgi:hypothetical protein
MRPSLLLAEVVDDAMSAATKMIGFDERACERDYFAVVHLPSHSGRRRRGHHPPTACRDYTGK